jgi:outer membrane protein OmpA-like peptidoglycan-associated protein
MNGSRGVTTVTSHRLFLSLAFSFLAVAGCATGPAHEGAYPNVRLAARNGAKVVSEQLKGAWGAAGTVWISPVINYHSGEVTASGREFQLLLALDLKTLLGSAPVKTLEGKGVSTLDWVLAPSVTMEKPKEGKLDQSWFRIDIAAVGPLGTTLPGATLRINAIQFDATPSRFFWDAPLFLTGRHHQERQEFLKGKRSSMSADARNRFIATEGLLQEAITNYEESDYRRAADGFARVLQKDPDNLAALSGRYQSLAEAGNDGDAESALSSLMASAIRQDNVSFKFLFQVASTEFREDEGIARRYGTWLKQLARQLQASGRCITVLGHASRSGADAVNRELSQARATKVMNVLLAQAPSLRSRMKAEGRSYHDNIVGSGTDDLADAIDRRVDFKLRTCS